MRISIFALTIALAGCGVAQAPSVGGATDVQPARGDVAIASDSDANAAVTPLGAVDIDLARLATARAGDTFDLNLGAVGRVATRTQRVERLDAGRFSWAAQTLAQGVPDGEATLIIDGSAITGSVRTPDGVLYRIKPSEHGNTIERVDTGQMPPD